jgi:hypothetical protein
MGIYDRILAVPRKIVRPWQPEFGPEGNHFVSGKSFFFWRSSEAAMDGGAHSAPFGVFISPEIRLRAAHGRAHTTKTYKKPVPNPSVEEH